MTELVKYIIEQVESSSIQPELPPAQPPALHNGHHANGYEHTMNLEPQMAFVVQAPEQPQEIEGEL
jgi:hypothetical protein